MPVVIPRNEGISGVRRLEGDEAGGAPFQKLKQGATLADLQKEYVLFNYAPIFLYAGLSINPVQEWINKHNHKQVVFILALDKPVLHMGAGAIWDRTLWAVEKEYWPSLRSHLGSMATIDRSKGKLCRIIVQTIPVLDVIAAEKPLVLESPYVMISTFTVDSNLGCIVFAPSTKLTGNCPYLKFHAPREETVRLANGLLLEVDKPYEACQLKPWEHSNEGFSSPAQRVRSIITSTKP